MGDVPLALWLCGVLRHTAASIGCERSLTDLRPVAEDLSVAAVRDELLWKLSDTVVEVVHDHVHDGGRVSTQCRVVADRVRSAHRRQQHSLEHGSTRSRLPTRKSIHTVK